VKDLSDGFSVIFRASEFTSAAIIDEYMAQVWPVLLLRAKHDYAAQTPQPLDRVCG
jgi:hypothetical protein